MGLEKVKEEIVEEAEEKADRKIHEAEKKAEEIVAEAEQKAEGIKSETREKARKEAESKVNKEVSSTRIEARRKKLEAKKETVDRAFDLFESKVRGMDQDEKTDLVKEILENLKSDIDIGKVWTSESLAEELELDGAEVETGEIDGLIVESTDGSIKHDYSFETIIEKVKQESRKDLSSILF